MKFSKVRRRLSRQFRAVAGFWTPRVDHADVIAAVAERLTSKQRADLSIEGRVLRNDRRRLVTTHEVSLAVATGQRSAPLLRLVEKRAADPQEHRFYCSVAGRPDGPRLAPQLYAATDHGFLARDPRRYVIVMEHMPRLGLPSESTRTAHDLAAAISGIAALPAEMHPHNKRYNRLSGRLLSRFLGLVHETGSIHDPATCRGAAEMSRQWHRLSAIAKLKLPWLPSHNDLHPDNLCPIDDAKRDGSFVFIDWEAFGQNYAGADLHHFIRLGLLEPELAPFCTALRQRYAELLREMHGLDVELVEIGAHAYALRRCMRRTLLGRNVSEIAVCLQLFQTLLRLLGRS